MNQYRRRLSRSFVITTLLVSLVLAHAPAAEAQAAPEDHAVISAHSWMCMDLPGFWFFEWLNHMDGAPMVQSQCSVGARQTWKLRPLDIHGNYQVVNALSGKCLDGGSGSVFQLSCSGATSQVWRRFWIKNHFLLFFGQIPLYGLQNAKSQDWLTATGGSNVAQGNFTRQDNQLWGFFNLQSARFVGI